MHDVGNWEWSQTMFVFTFLYVYVWLYINLIIYVFAFFRWVVSSCKPYLSHTLFIILCKSMFESFSFRPWALNQLPVKCSYVIADCSFSLALCTENKCFSTIYYVPVGYENLGIPLSDTSKSMAKTKPERHPLIIKLLLSLWLLYKNYINYYTLPVHQLISSHYYSCIFILNICSLDAFLNLRFQVETQWNTLHKLYKLIRN